MILFDGCSYTMGLELENTKDRFSTLVSDYYNTEHVNLAGGGKSNDGILRTTLEYCESHEVNFAVIQFTKYSRREIMDRKRYYRRLTANSRERGTKEWFTKIATEEDNVANFYKNKFLLENYFANKHIPYFFLQLSSPITSPLTSSWEKMSPTPVDCIYKILGGDELSGSPLFTSSDKPHPNVEGHRRIADHIILKNPRGIF